MHRLSLVPRKGRVYTGMQPLVDESLATLKSTVNFCISDFVLWKKKWNFLIVDCTWENSQHLATPSLVFLQNDIWGMSKEIPYWWCVTTQIWVVLLIGRAARECPSTFRGPSLRFGCSTTITCPCVNFFARDHYYSARFSTHTIPSNFNKPVQSKTEVGLCYHSWWWRLPGYCWCS